MVASNAGGRLKQCPQTLPPCVGNAQTGQALASHGRSRMQASQTRSVPDPLAHNSHRCGKREARGVARAASDAVKCTRQKI